MLLASRLCTESPDPILAVVWIMILAVVIVVGVAIAAIRKVGR